MSAQTKSDGASDSALVLEQRVRDLCHDEIFEKGVGTEVAYDLIANEPLLDGSARLNLAMFVTTWMPPAAALMGLTADKNMIDKDEYPQTAEIERRCVNIIGRVWHAPGTGDVTGTSTTGSSEAAMLGGLALKWRWRERMKTAGKPTDRPNLVTGTNVQVCWEKFYRYWDVEPRLVPMEGERFHLGAEEAAAMCDQNTIGVVAVLGSTFDGSYEPVKEICEALDRLAAAGGPDVPVHVDGASGGFIAPFVQPDLVWDFQLPRVQSINASGHKYGLVYPGVGWAIWRDEEALPRDLVFDVSARLREHGWLVPAYTFPENRQDLAVLRVVVRAGMSHDMADLLLIWRDGCQVSSVDRLPRCGRGGW
jgi:glutamate decarboxylase